MTLSPSYVEQRRRGDARDRILDHLDQVHAATTMELAGRTRLPWNSVAQLCTAMERQGVLRRAVRSWRGPRGGRYEMTEWLR